MICKKIFLNLPVTWGNIVTKYGKRGNYKWVKN